MRNGARIQGASLLGIGLLGVFLLAPRLALATFPGANGQIAWQGAKDYGQPNGAPAIFATAGELVPIDNSTTPPRYWDTFPAWSPDGSQLAFVRIDNTLNVYSLNVVDQTGNNLRTLVQSSAFGPPGIYFSEPAWTADGQTITFAVSSHLNVRSLYSVSLDGSSLAQVTPSNYPSFPNWSSRGELVYQCQFRYSDPQQTVPYDDICYIDTTGALHQIAVNLPATTGARVAGNQTFRPNWSAAGDKILLTILWSPTQGHQVYHSDVFWFNEADGSLTQLTNPPDSCPSPSYGGNSYASRIFYAATPSPDGQSIVATGVHWNDEQDTPNSCDEGVGGGDQVGLWRMDLNGNKQSFFFAAVDATVPTWQPLPKGVSLTVLDGHGHPIDGAQVDIRDVHSGFVLEQNPLNQGLGTYTFPDGLAAGNYVARITLTDNCGASCTTPAFDVQFAPTGNSSSAAWVEFPFTVQSPTQLTSATLDFANSTPSFASIDPTDYGHLSDMAAIFYFVHQYVWWVEATLTGNIATTVHYLTFAEFDPSDPASPETLDPKYAAYSPELSAVLMGPTSSEYATRDPSASDPDHDHDGPENEEWHEYTHFLYDTLLGLRCDYASSSDPNGDTNHAGWANPDTCDSMDEGFATFLPTIAGQSIFSTSSDVYANMADLSAPWNAWSTQASSGKTYYREEFAVAALLLNMVQPTLNLTYGTVYGANGLPFPTALLYDNFSAGVSLSTLWAQLQNPPSLVSNVYELRQTFLSTPLVYDLDKDGTNDVASIDIPFILHGFYPVDGDQQRSENALYYYYDVAYATTHGQSPRDADVGVTSHSFSTSDGTKKFVPRYKVPLAPTAHLGVAVVDQGGNPVSGATISLTLSYPDGHQSTLRSTSGNALNQVHLELPQYYNYYLPPGAPLPACDPTNDTTITVTVSASLNGVTSTNAPSFDNCAYTQAVAAASGPTAINATLILPIAASAFSVGGTVTGLSGSLTLLDNNGAPLVITADGPFVFPATIPNGGAYSVTVSAQPAGRSCTVANGSGTIGDGNVASVAVTCMPAQEDITASLSFSESGIVLNRATGTFNFTVTFRNTSSSTYGGPIWLLITGLPSGTNLANSSGSTNTGIPYISVSAPNGQLAPGASVTQLVAVSNPARVGLKPAISVWAYAP